MRAPSCEQCHRQPWTRWRASLERAEVTRKACFHRIPTNTRISAQPCVRSVCAGKASYSNANFPTDPEGRTYHLGTKAGSP